MFCSTIIATVGRDSLSRAVESVLAQKLNPEDHEIIVVNDSGKPLAPLACASDSRVRIVTTMRRERCVARNTGAAMAYGDYLHFLDDDDWLAPGALSALHELATRNPAAGFLYGATQVVDRQDRPLIQLRPNFAGNCSVQTMAGEWIPLQSSLVATRQFFVVGCFNVLIPGAEDIDLLRRLTLVTDVAYTEAIVGWVRMGQSNSTTDYANHDHLARIGREHALSQKIAYSRMRSAAATAGWKGRLVRVYMTSAAWNIKHRNLSTAFGRSLMALKGTFSAGTALLQPEFYRSARTRYESNTFARGFAEVRPAGEQRAADGRSV